MSAEGIIREAAAAAEYCRRYGCKLDVLIGGGWGRAPIHVQVTPEDWGSLGMASSSAGQLPAPESWERAEAVPKTRRPVRDTPQA